MDPWTSAAGYSAVIHEIKLYYTRARHTIQHTTNIMLRMRLRNTAKAVNAALLEYIMKLQHDGRKYT